MTSVSLHGQSYSLPNKPTVAICVDGFDPEYLEQGIADGILPNIKAMVSLGWHNNNAKVAVPTFTNPNNVSIITGQPTSVHGIAGNYFLDRETWVETMIEDDSLLRGSTILEQLSLAGVRVAAITAKDKLRRIIAHGLNPAQDIVFSAQLADKANKSSNGIENVETYVGRAAPSQYSGDLSLFVIDAGLKILADNKADFLYLTLSDYIQHKHAPGSDAANEFLSALDDKVGQLIRLGALVAITGDHGMSDKCLPDGTPNVLFVQDALDAEFGPDCARVICPITDPFVAHHGALGSFVRIYLKEPYKSRGRDMIAYLRTLPQVEVAVSGEEGSVTYELPLDREGDIIVMSVHNAVLGSRKEEHPLEALHGHRLRSHGGLSEQDVPLILSVPIAAEKVGEAGKKHWHNYDIFDLLLNYSS